MVTLRAVRLPTLVADAALATGVATASIAGTALLIPDRGRDPLGAALLAVVALPLLVRRAHPTAALLLIVAGSFVYSLLDFAGGFFTLPLGVALYFAVDADQRRRALVGAVGAFAGLVAVGFILHRGHVSDLTNATWFGALLAASLVLGEVVRGRRAYLEQVEQRAFEAERGREEEALRRAGQERIRIARELHDVLAHRISSISVQSGVALHLIDRDPAQARDALVAINRASKQALQELRATLGVLRQADEAEPRTPTPGLSQLDAVVSDSRAAGVDVRVERTGIADELPSSVDLAAYRIVQEALTNVVRHARASHARVAITQGRHALDIEIDDDGHGVAPGWRSGVGHGLLGMHERVAALGGEFEAGPRKEGGFRVWARLPTGSPP
jgi:signal transduction histidine kinase